MRKSLPPESPLIPLLDETISKLDQTLIKASTEYWLQKNKKKIHQISTSVKKAEALVTPPFSPLTLTLFKGSLKCRICISQKIFF